MAYSDAQVAQAMAEAVAQGFTLDQAVQGAIQNFGVPSEQATRIASAQTSLKDQNFDTQALTSIYRQTVGRNPTQDEYQYFQSLGQSQGLTAEQLRGIVQSAAMVEQQQQGINENFTTLTLPDFEADPFAGRYATNSIYNVPSDPANQINISTINGRQVQFVNPITQLAVISDFTNKGAGTTNQFTDAQVAAYLRDNQYSNPAQVQQAITMFGVGQEQLSRAVNLLSSNDPSIAAASADYAARIAANPALIAENAAATAAATAYTSTPGVETLSVPRITEAVNRAFEAGSLTDAEYSAIVNSLSLATNPEDIRNILATPVGSVIIDPIYGQQIGEDDTLATALAEAAERQAVLTAQDPGYYQSNDDLSQAYAAAGLDFPFNPSSYQANTMMTQADALTSANFNQRVNELLSSLNQQFGGANTVRAPQTGQYYSETGLQPGFTPFGTEGTTFRSGVAGYIPQAQLPTRFDFGAPPINIAIQQYRPGLFQPSGVATGGFITGYNADGTPIYSTYADPNVNVGGATSAANPFTPTDATAIADLQAQIAAMNAATAAAANQSAGGG
jgi:hypothetical protein